MIDHKRVKGGVGFAEEKRHFAVLNAGAIRW